MTSPITVRIPIRNSLVDENSFYCLMGQQILNNSKGNKIKTGVASYPKIAECFRLVHEAGIKISSSNLAIQKMKHISGLSELIAPYIDTAPVVKSVVSESSTGVDTTPVVKSVVAESSTGVDTLSVEDIHRQYSTKRKYDAQIAAKYAKKYEQCVKRNILFDLSFQEFYDLCMTEHCYYTNMTLLKREDDSVSFDHNNSLKPNALTLDRIDCTKGYVPGNVVACAHIVNAWKEQVLECKTRLGASLTAIDMLNIILKVEDCKNERSN